MATTGPALSAVSVLAVRRRVWPLAKLTEQQRKSALGVCVGPGRINHGTRDSRRRCSDRLPRGWRPSLAVGSHLKKEVTELKEDALDAECKRSLCEAIDAYIERIGAAAQLIKDKYAELNECAESS